MVDRKLWCCRGWQRPSMRPRPSLARIGRYMRATSMGSGDGIGRHPAVPRFPVNYRSIIWMVRRRAPCRRGGRKPECEAAREWMLESAAMPLVKPFRALRYDVGVAGPLDTLIAPPYDVIAPSELEGF